MDVKVSSRDGEYAPLPQGTMEGPKPDIQPMRISRSIPLPSGPHLTINPLCKVDIPKTTEDMFDANEGDPWMRYKFAVSEIISSSYSVP